MPQNKHSKDSRTACGRAGIPCTRSSRTKSSFRAGVEVDWQRAIIAFSTLGLRTCPDTRKSHKKRASQRLAEALRSSECSSAKSIKTSVGVEFRVGQRRVPIQWKDFPFTAPAAVRTSSILSCPSDCRTAATCKHKVDTTACMSRRIHSYQLQGHNCRLCGPPQSLQRRATIR